MVISFRDIFSSSDLGTFGTPLTTGDIISSILFSVITGLYIFYIYKITFSGILYSKNFNITLILVTMVGSVIMMAIGGNLALALGMVGALSIIRFRTPVKDPKDITFLFWSMTAGIVNGIRFYKLSIISSIIIGLVLVALSKRIVVHKPFILILKDNKINLKRLNSVLKSNCKKFDVRNTSIDEAGASERTVEVIVKENHSDKLVKELKEINGVKKVMLFSHEGELSE